MQSDLLNGLALKRGADWKGRTMAVVNALSLCMIFGLAGSSASMAAHLPDSPIIHIEDVAAFYKLYDATNGHPTAENLQSDYIDPGSPGLHHLAEIRNVTGVSIAKALAAHPQIFSDAKRCMTVLPRVRVRVAAALRTLARLYPKAEFPSVTIAISRGKPAGFADASGVIIGLEATCAANYFNRTSKTDSCTRSRTNTPTSSKRCSRQLSTISRSPQCWTPL